MTYSHLLAIARRLRKHGLDADIQARIDALLEIQPVGGTGEDDDS